MPACFSASLIAISASGTYACSPNRSSQTCEASSPGTRQRSRNSFVAAPPPMRSASARRVEHRAREEECDSGVATVALVGATRQTRCACRTAPPRSGIGDMLANRCAATADRTEPTMSNAAVCRRAGRARRGSRWRSSCRRTEATTSRTRRPVELRSPAALIARRAASTPIEVVSSSYEATARVPLPPPAPSAAPIAARCSR